MSNIFQEDNGSWSSIRVILFFLIIFCVVVYLDWRWAFKIEMLKENVNYDGIVSLFREMLTVFVGGTILTIVFKVVQKKFENKKGFIKEDENSIKNDHNYDESNYIEKNHDEDNNDK